MAQAISWDEEYWIINDFKIVSELLLGKERISGKFYLTGTWSDCFLMNERNIVKKF